MEHYCQLPTTSTTSDCTLNLLPSSRIFTMQLMLASFLLVLMLMNSWFNPYWQEVLWLFLSVIMTPIKSNVLASDTWTLYCFIFVKKHNLFYNSLQKKCLPVAIAIFTNRFSALQVLVCLFYPTLLRSHPVHHCCFWHF